MKSNTSMLAYCKHILKSVSFDRKLFRKEYRKSLKYLVQPEVVELKRWIRNGV